MYVSNAENIASSEFVRQQVCNFDHAFSRIDATLQALMRAHWAPECTGGDSASMHT